MVIAKQAFIAKWGISYVLFALAFGLIISNIFKVPKILKAAGQTEFFVKIDGQRHLRRIRQYRRRRRRPG